MKIHRDIQQKSWDWFRLRAGKVTGSELKNLITDKLAIRKWTTEMPNSYLHRKVAEKWRGEALQSFGGNQQTDQGTIYEEQARNFFASLLEADIETVGGIESADERLWCSPDGLIESKCESCGGDGIETCNNPEHGFIAATPGDISRLGCPGCGHDPDHKMKGPCPDCNGSGSCNCTGLEIKCPNADTHVGWLLAGGVPEEHYLQVQFSLWVSGFKRWQFLSWCKNFPHLEVTLEPDAEVFSVMESAVMDFNARLDAAYAKLVELNGGPPPKRKVFVPSPESEDNPYVDINP